MLELLAILSILAPKLDQIVPALDQCAGRSKKR
jgi:hypothetical protein